MKITFLNIKFFFGEKLLQKLLKKGNDRQVKSCNVEDAKSMGMICVIKNKSGEENKIEVFTTRPDILISGNFNSKLHSMSVSR